MELNRANGSIPVGATGSQGATVAVGGSNPALETPTTACSHRLWAAKPMGQGGRKPNSSSRQGNSSRLQFRFQESFRSIPFRIDQPGLPVESRRCKSSFTARVGAVLNASSR
jgi:hypothetical protein